MIKTPHFAFPFRREGGRVVAVEQDTAEHVMGCEQVISRTPLGVRLERPEFGWPHPTFRNAPLDPQGLLQALRRFEPRSQVTGHEQAIDVANQAARLLEVEVPFDG